eukprot:sb/3477191/
MSSLRIRRSKSTHPSLRYFCYKQGNGSKPAHYELKECVTAKTQNAQKANLYYLTTNLSNSDPVHSHLNMTCLLPACYRNTTSSTVSGDVFLPVNQGPVNRGPTVYNNSPH